MNNNEIRGQISGMTLAGELGMPQFTPMPECQYNHVVFVLHGIGKHDESTSYYSNVEKMSKKFDGLNPCFDNKVKFIAIEWHEDLHKKLEESQLESVRPGGVPSLRNFVKDNFMDLLLWASPFYSSFLYTLVTCKFNQAYVTFMDHYPNFKGKISILAHSLGSVIIYDILCNHMRENQWAKTDSGNISLWMKMKDMKERCRDEKMKHIEWKDLYFDVYNLYLIGSPLAMMLGVRGYSDGIPIPNCINIWNIYNEHDPVAYLIEPLIDKRFTEQPVQPLPRVSKRRRHRKNKELRAQNSGGELRPSLSTPELRGLSAPAVPGSESNSNSSESSEDDSSETITIQTGVNTPELTMMEEGSSHQASLYLQRTKRLNISLFAGIRYDYRFKPKGIRTLTEISSILSAHSSYWLSKHILNFIGINLQLDPSELHKPNE
ncbi:hypothetical protein SAMD00019534_019510 [Acytostelium subglobosum LB1]|uniref:hypothetical protein n=1 Tax=Acytostelium subglobosum LB1 TaxID=1410327 RepID=UPI000644F04E|nr:hypothetical protein SAMD00019534_019510 [Acytostelium subglobosum LB1]GAM18776.1 hypothetical protein SAMD00019534_019510 [Acytostelium subglobosum LB1]|eukprot:XP_012757996.1 hypothetical protein SAMD00019534_019510 [Acytostelium subglobosum LB1]